MEYPLNQNHKRQHYFLITDTPFHICILKNGLNIIIEHLSLVNLFMSHIILIFSHINLIMSHIILAPAYCVQTPILFIKGTKRVLTRAALAFVNSRHLRLALKISMSEDNKLTNPQGNRLERHH